LNRNLLLAFLVVNDRIPRLHCSASLSLSRALDPVNLSYHSFSSSEPMDTIEPSRDDEGSIADQQQGQQQQQEQQQQLAEVSRAEIEKGDLDNAPEGVDEPIQMVDLLESERTMPSVAQEATPASDGATESGRHQQQQNLQVVNSLPLKP
jgi:hypothetical protein